MSEWINCKIAKPPSCHQVLLYIVNFIKNPDGKISYEIFDDEICTGFYDDENDYKPAYYLDNWQLGENIIIKESEDLKVIAWTLCPRKPYKSIINKGGDIGEWTG